MQSSILFQTHSVLSLTDHFRCCSSMLTWRTSGPNTWSNTYRRAVRLSPEVASKTSFGFFPDTCSRIVSVAPSVGRRGLTRTATRMLRCWAAESIRHASAHVCYLWEIMCSFGTHG